MEKVKRPLLLTGLIIMIASYALFFIGCLALVGLMEEFNLPESFFGIIIILAIVSVVGIILSSIGLTACGKPYHIYTSKGKYVLAASIILAVLLVLSLLGSLNENLGGGGQIIVYIIMALGVIFTIIGHNKAKQSNNNVNVVNENEDAYQKIERLKQLRNDDIITEEEYQALLKKEIDDLY